MIEAARVVRCFLYQMLTAALALAVLPPAAARRAVAPAFPTEWQGKSELMARVITAVVEENRLHKLIPAPSYTKPVVQPGMRGSGRPVMGTVSADA
jgi:hypothetical protein